MRLFTPNPYKLPMSQGRKERAQKSPAQAELKRIVGANESLRGFAQPRQKWDRRRFVCPCGGDGSYVEGGMLRVCKCRR